jgi:hypothetical protein
MANKDFKVKNGLDIQTPLPVSMGGTGQTSSENTLNALLPTQTGNENKVLQTDGTNTSWITPPKGLNSGTLAQRPGSASNGDLYFNTDDMEIEVWQNGNWLIANVTPGAPTGVTATNQGSGRAFNNGQASVAFTPATTGGPVKTFTVTPSPSTSPSTFTGSSSPITVTNLASSTQYTYTVTGGSNVGTSAASVASTGVTATTVPQAPTTVTPTNTAGAAYGSSTNSVSVPITANGTGGSTITSYTTVSNPGSFTATGASSPLTVSGLSVGTAYTFTSTVANANGTSLSSPVSPSITPSTVPQAPTIGTATAGSGSATVTFTTGATGGSTITSYTATSSPGGITGSSATSPITVNGLTNGTTYTFTVTATNANGTSTTSAASNSATPIQPGNWNSISSFVATGGESTISISNIPNTYTHLVVRMLILGDSASVNRLSFTNSNFNYQMGYIYGTNNIGATQLTNQSFVYVDRYNSSTASSDPSVAQVVFPYYSSPGIYKSWQSLGGGVNATASNSEILMTAGHAEVGTAAISTITLTRAGGTFISGTVLAIYGLTT